MFNSDSIQYYDKFSPLERTSSGAVSIVATSYFACPNYFLDTYLGEKRLITIIHYHKFGTNQLRLQPEV